MSRMVRVYPAAWRDRYEAEFLALLQERPPTLVGRFDIVRGAVDAHLHPQVRRPTDGPPEPERPDADLRVVRRLGIGAIVGAAVWIAAVAVASVGPIRYDEQGAYRDGGSAFALLLLAVGLVAAGLIGQLLWLPAGARLGRLGAGMAIPFVILWGLAPWLMWTGLVALVGLVALAVGGWRSHAWSIGPSVAVIGACIAVVALVAFGIATTNGDRLAGAEFFAAVAAALVPAWLSVGATLIRRTA